MSTEVLQDNHTSPPWPTLPAKRIYESAKLRAAAHKPQPVRRLQVQEASCPKEGDQSWSATGRPCARCSATFPPTISAPISTGRAKQVRARPRTLCAHACPSTQCRRLGGAARARASSCNVGLTANAPHAAAGPRLAWAGRRAPPARPRRARAPAAHALLNRRRPPLPCAAPRLREPAAIPRLQTPRHWPSSSSLPNSTPWSTQTCRRVALLPGF